MKGASEEMQARNQSRKLRKVVHWTGDSKAVIARRTSKGRIQLAWESEMQREALPEVRFVNPDSWFKYTPDWWIYTSQLRSTHAHTGQK